MKATIRERVSGRRLADSVPPPYRDEVVKDTRPDGQYTLVLLGHNRRDVIHSAPLRRAFRRLDSPAPDGTIVVGAAFTEEAKALAAEHGARLVSFHKKARWTDDPAVAIDDRGEMVVAWVDQACCWKSWTSTPTVRWSSPTAASSVTHKAAFG
jgi:hypothetical protein